MENTKISLFMTEHLDVLNEDSRIDLLHSNQRRQARQRQTLERRRANLARLLSMPIVKIPARLWIRTIDTYLNSIAYAFDKGEDTSRKVGDVLDHLPEPGSRRVVQVTLALLVVSLVVFFVT